MVAKLINLFNHYLNLLILAIFVSFPASSIYFNRPVHHLLPFTTWDQLKTCEEVFSVEIELQKALQCSNETFFNKEPYNIYVSTPSAKCYVITEKSPDLKHGTGYNYIGNSILNDERIMGFYDPTLDIMFISYTPDMDEIYRHEMQHYFLQKVLGDGDGKHELNIWKTCETAYYNPNKTKKR